MTEHSYRVIWISIIIYIYEKSNIEIDLEKLIKLGLIHDLGEIRSLDTNRLSKKYVDRNEELALKDTFKGTSVENDVIELLKESHNLSSIEIQILKDADILDTVFELIENSDKGNKLAIQLLEIEKKTDINFFTSTAKLMFNALLSESSSSRYLREIKAIRNLDHNVD